MRVPPGARLQGVGAYSPRSRGAPGVLHGSRCVSGATRARACKVWRVAYGSPVPGVRSHSLPVACTHGSPAHSRCVYHSCAGACTLPAPACSPVQGCKGRALIATAPRSRGTPGAYSPRSRGAPGVLHGSPVCDGRVDCKVPRCKAARCSRCVPVLLPALTVTALQGSRRALP